MADDFTFYQETSYSSPAYNAANFSFYVTPVASFVSSTALAFIGESTATSDISIVGQAVAAFQNSDVALSFIGSTALNFLTAEVSPSFSGIGVGAFVGASKAAAALSTTGQTVLDFAPYYEASIASSSTTGFVVTKVTDLRGVFTTRPVASFAGLFEVPFRGVFSGIASPVFLSGATDDRSATFSGTTVASFSGTKISDTALLAGGDGAFSGHAAGVLSSIAASAGQGIFSAYALPSADGVLAASGSCACGFVGGHTSVTPFDVPRNVDTAFVRVVRHSVVAFS